MAETPSVAGMYDYYLGGTDNTEVDREYADRVLRVVPEGAVLAKANRAFAVAAAQRCIGLGLDQIIDLGTGVPTAPNVFDAIRALASDAVVVGVDNEPAVVSRIRQRYPHDNAIVPLLADARRVSSVFDELSARIDFGRPVAVLLVALLHFVADDHEAAEILGQVRQRIAPGSLVAISHLTSTGTDPAVAGRITEIYRQASSPLVFRSEPEILRLFEGLELDESGLVDVHLWHSTTPLPDLSVRVIGGLARRP